MIEQLHFQFQNMNFQVFGQILGFCVLWYILLHISQLLLHLDFQSYMECKWSYTRLIYGSPDRFWILYLTFLFFQWSKLQLLLVFYFSSVQNIEKHIHQYSDGSMTNLSKNLHQKWNFKILYDCLMRYEIHQIQGLHDSLASSSKKCMFQFGNWSLPLSLSLLSIKLLILLYHKKSKLFWRPISSQLRNLTVNFKVQYRPGISEKGRLLWTVFRWKRCCRYYRWNLGYLECKSKPWSHIESTYPFRDQLSNELCQWWKTICIR